MCGIVGILNRSQSVDRDILERMSNEIVHRGPDDSGFHISGRVGLGVRRLSVIDLEGGAQPIANEDKNCWIVYNGETYNYPSLREHLVETGHELATHSDTETIVHLYETHGAACVDHLNGMFAFAVHDNRDDSVLIARDRLGIKPLYYAETDDALVFGSEIKALLTHPSVSRQIDPNAIDAFLTLKFIPAPQTAYRSIRKLPPGHLLRWQNGATKIERYWQPDYSQKDARTDHEIVRDFGEKFEEAIRSQMLSDVPLGAFLSGGLDSSLIVSAMARISDRPIETFSIGFEETSYNELENARVVADHFGTNHHELIVRPNVSELFETVVSQFDEPFGDSSAIPTYLVSELARRHVTIALSGTGADELFAGYERYWSIPLSAPFQALPHGIVRGLSKGLQRLPSGHGKRSVINRAQRFLQSQGADLVERHTALISLFDGATRKEGYTADFSEAVASHSAIDTLRLSLDDRTGLHDLDRMLGLDTQTVLPDDYLTKDDRMSMATSLEVRVPFLDHTLVEFAAACPPRLKQKHLQTKVLLRQLAQDQIPRSILDRPKHGFEVPVAEWIGNELAGTVTDLLLSDSTQLGAYLRPEFVSNLVELHTSEARNLSREIWSLMSLEMWLRSGKAGV